MKLQKNTISKFGKCWKRNYCVDYVFHSNAGVSSNVGRQACSNLNFCSNNFAKESETTLGLFKHVSWISLYIQAMQAMTKCGSWFSNIPVSSSLLTMLNTCAKVPVTNVEKILSLFQEKEGATALTSACSIAYRKAWHSQTKPCTVRRGKICWSTVRARVETSWYFRELQIYCSFIDVPNS